MECAQIDLYEFLTESELQHYYNTIRNELKITNAAQFKYATDDDLKNIGLSRPEIRRLRKFYDKHFPHGYLSKIKRLLQAPTNIVRRENEANFRAYHNETNEGTSSTPAKNLNSPNKATNNKHIIPADSISVNKELGAGEFGIVQQGVWTNGTERIQVAIKCLCRERMQSNPMEFLKEAAIMHSIEHENIVRLYGVVLSTDSLMLVTELAHLRSLLECLKDSGLRVSFLTVPTLCEFATQICSGMKYLEQNRLIHRDLAARNILVFSKHKVKISDFGLSRALGVGKDYYKTNFNVNLKLPIAWCAPECIKYLRFTNASDVWAFGVCLWEMFSYGFQPWAALTGLQIFEAIDAPNFQRLEQPECCPSEYYTLMMKCWQDDPVKRPKFNEISEHLPEIKPEQLKAIVNYSEIKKDNLLYRQGEIITVLDRNTGTPFWKGVLVNGKTGFFNPSNTVAFLEGLPSSNRDAFSRLSDHRSSKKKLRTEMISKPQNDLKHTGHVGIDGAIFGDIAFLGSTQNYTHVPRQIVTPYKPSEDIEQTPLLLPPTPTSPDSLQTASGYFAENINATSINPTFSHSNESTPKNLSNNSHNSFNFQCHQKVSNTSPTNPFSLKNDDDQFAFAMQNNNYGFDNKTISSNSLNKDSSFTQKQNLSEDSHEYHEISDDEIITGKIDLGPSLLDEINSMFGSISGTSNNLTKNEFSELSSKSLNSGNEANSGFKNSLSNSSKKKAAGTVKPISVKDEKILNQAIEIANEISARSMVDLVTDHPPTTHSPKRKFSFRFPHLSNTADKSVNNCTSTASSGSQHVQHGNLSPFTKKKNFTEELQSIPDIQTIIGEEGREAYNSLIERKNSLIMNMGLSPAEEFLRHMDTNEFDIMSSKTLPRFSTCSSNDSTKNRPSLLQKEIRSQAASRPMTLPTRGCGGRVRKHELSQFNQQNDENFNLLACEANNSNPNKSTTCKSTQNFISTACKSPNQTELTHRNTVDDTNVVPLPPREGKKQVKTNAKRHVRKYPLNIPLSGLQRTLNNVIDVTTINASPNIARNESLDNTRSTEVVTNISSNNSKCLSVTASSPFTSVSYENIPIVIENKTFNGTLAQAEVHCEHSYLNLEKPDVTDSVGKTDSASLHFESILEADSNKGVVLPSPDVTDGFYNFSIQKEHYVKNKKVDFDVDKMSDFYVNKDELRNLDTCRNLQQTESDNPISIDNTIKPTMSEGKKYDILNKQSHKNTNTSTNNELAGNALFKKMHESVDAAIRKFSISDSPLNKGALVLAETNKGPYKEQTEAEYFNSKAVSLANCNSVSCEDLLEFCNKKPKGCERGVDSDEVRIMIKVLGIDTTPDRCLKTLEFINWDVHKAIKIIKFQNILPDKDLSILQSFNILEKYDWDLHLATYQLKEIAP